MRNSSRRLASLTLLVSLALVGLTPSVLASGTTTVTLAGNDFNGSVPVLHQTTPVYPAWTAVLFPFHRFENSSSTFNVDFVSTTSPSTFGASGASALSYTQGSGWFQYVRVQLKETGEAWVYYLENSTSGNTINVFHCLTCYLSNATAVGTLTTNTEDAINPGAEVWVSVAGGFLSVGSFSATGTLTTWVKAFGLPNHGLGGTWLSGTTTLGGVDFVNGGCGAYHGTNGLSCHPTEATGAGYLQVEFNAAGFTSGVAVQQTTNTVLQIVPLIVIIAVIGMVVGILKRFKV
jgi:hypothetical protein